MTPSQLSLPPALPQAASETPSETPSGAAPQAPRGGPSRSTPPGERSTVGHNNSVDKPTAMSFADVAHQTIIFDPQDHAAKLILELLDTSWVQRLRRLRQTGHANLVYMFAEHSRFGHSLGVAYVAHRLMKNLSRHHLNQVTPFRKAVAAAALMHDLGHVAPGSHLGERIWSRSGKGSHETISGRVIAEDPEILEILTRHDPELPHSVARILAEDPGLPPWTTEIISGGGWNADRGNWTIVDSAMCSVSYGRYNVFALLDSYRLSPNGHLVLQENRLDALTHFFVARDSMYRQVYQHRVIQGIDALAERLVCRLRDLITENGWASVDATLSGFSKLGTFCDHTMAQALRAGHYGRELPLDTVFLMTESWWGYHLEHWPASKDPVVADLATRLRDRKILKTVRLAAASSRRGSGTSQSVDPVISEATKLSASLGFDPRYYVISMTNADMHRAKKEEIPSVILDSGEIVRADTVEPLIGELIQRTPNARTWLAVPKEVKEKLGRLR